MNWMGKTRRKSLEGIVGGNPPDAGRTLAHRYPITAINSTASTDQNGERTGSKRWAVWHAMKTAATTTKHT